MTTRSATPTRPDYPDTIPNVLKFDGVDDVVTITPTLASQDYTFTIKNINEAWGKTGLVSINNAHFRFDRWGGIYNFSWKNAANVQQYIYGVAWNSAKGGTLTLVQNGTGGYVKVYQNGVEIASAATAGGATYAGGTVRLGKTDVGYWKLRHGDFIMHSTALTPTEIQNLHLYSIIPTNGLVGHWNEISADGTQLLDSVGGNHGTITGAVRETNIGSLPYMPRKSIVPYVGSYNFDANDYVTLASEVTPVTIDFVANASSLLSNTYFSNLANTKTIQQSSANKWDFYDGSDRLASLSNHLRIGDWARWTFVWNGSGYLIYKNGIIADQTTSGTQIPIGLIGRNGGTSLGGKLSSVRFFSVALTPSEVETLTLHNTTPYDKDPAICKLNLEAKTDVMSGSTWRDVSGNGNHGTLSGATLSPDAPTKERNRDPENLVYNGDFHVRPYTVAATTTSSRWIDGTAGGSSTSLRNSFGLFQSGSGTRSAQFTEKNGRRCLHINIGAGSYEIVFMNVATYRNPVHLNGFAMKPSTQYHFSAWMMSENVTGDSNNGFSLTIPKTKEDGVSASGGDSNETIPVTGNIKTNIPDWTYYERTFTSPADVASAFINPIVYGHTGAATLAGDFYFADIRLTEL